METCVHNSHCTIMFYHELTFGKMNMKTMNYHTSKNLEFIAGHRVKAKIYVFLMLIFCELIHYSKTYIYPKHLLQSFTKDLFNQKHMFTYINLYCCFCCCVDYGNNINLIKETHN